MLGVGGAAAVPRDQHLSARAQGTADGVGSGARGGKKLRVMSRATECLERTPEIGGDDFFAFSHRRYSERLSCVVIGAEGVAQAAFTAWPCRDAPARRVPPQAPARAECHRCGGGRGACNRAARTCRRRGSKVRWP